MNETQSSCECSSHGSQVRLEKQDQQCTTSTQLDYLKVRQDSISKCDKLYMSIAHQVAEQSRDKIHKVGCVVVKDNNIISMGYNGTPTGMDNKMRDTYGKTLPTVLHSEENALMKLAKTGGSSDGATLYCTHNPCWGCSRLLIQAGIARVVYCIVYDSSSLELLKSANIEVIQYEVV